MEPADAARFRPIWLATLAVVALAGNAAAVPTVNDCAIRPWTTCRGANLSKADLERARLGEADLEGADLSGANLRGADLVGANLIDANFKGADLRDADLT